MSTPASNLPAKKSAFANFKVSNKPISTQYVSGGAIYAKNLFSRPAPVLVSQEKTLPKPEKTVWLCPVSLSSNNLLSLKPTTCAFILLRNPYLKINIEDIDKQPMPSWQA